MYESTFTPRQSNVSVSFEAPPYFVRRTSGYESAAQEEMAQSLRQRGFHSSSEAKTARSSLTLQPVAHPQIKYEEAVSSPEPVSPKASPPSKSQTKNKYQCPYKKTMGCDITFTTSGHAARHAKVHTGEKNVLCPVCNKAFTRKDNMKQHQRTHENGRGAASGGGRVTDDSRVKKLKLPTSKKVVRSVVEAMGTSPVLSSEEPVPAVDLISHRPRLHDYTFDRSSYMGVPRPLAHRSNGSYAESLWSGPTDNLDSPTGGLDALALAATRLPSGNSGGYMV